MEYLTVRETRKNGTYQTDGAAVLYRRPHSRWRRNSGTPGPSPPTRKSPRTPVLSRKQAKPPAPNLLDSAGLMPLMNTPFQPGTCMPRYRPWRPAPSGTSPRRSITTSPGQPEKAARAAAAYLTGPDMGAQLSACLIYAYANLSLHQIQHARFALDEVQMFLTEGAEQTPLRKAAAAFVAATSAVLLHLPLPESLPSTQEFLPLLPTGLRAFALYVQAHYLYLHQNYTQSIGIVESTLAMGAEQYPITAIYLHLMAVMDYMSMRQTETARKHLLAAWALARPDDLIEGFGEHHGLLGGMLEAVIKPRWPEDFRRIIDITGQFSWGWRQIHNPDTGHQVADNLTSTEFAVAMLVVRGWTTDEIAAHMKVSASTIKKHQAQIKRQAEDRHLGRAGALYAGVTLRILCGTPHIVFRKPFDAHFGDNLSKNMRLSFHAYGYFLKFDLKVQFQDSRFCAEFNPVLGIKRTIARPPKLCYNIPVNRRENILRAV